MRAEPRILRADYADPRQAAALVALLDAYARDPMGGGAPLPARARAELPARLNRIPGAFSLLAYLGAAPVGLVNCFEGFSTFACRPLLNVHDLAVLPAWRGRGIGRALLARVEAIARERDCCKLTLEVLQGNRSAQALYRVQGFHPYQLNPVLGSAEFWQKDLE
jgi:ribosomal protein S18 acetylase RimI-like enzyme